ADRDAALSFAQTCLTGAAEGGADEAAGTGHVVIAWMSLTRQLTALQRATLAMRADVEAARSSAQAAASLLAELGTFEIAPADAATAITHLRQASQAPGDAA